MRFRRRTTPQLLDTASLIDVGDSDGTVVKPADAEYKDVGAALDAMHENGARQLGLRVTFVPSSDDALKAPVLHDCELRYGCVAAH